MIWGEGERVEGMGGYREAEGEKEERESSKVGKTKEREWKKVRVISTVKKRTSK